MLRPQSSYFSKYLDDIGKIPVLTEEEEKQLVDEIKNGNNEAREKLIKSNLRLVVSIAKKFKCNIPLVDLVEEGNLALIESIETFDSSIGRLSTYATKAIKWKIKRYIDYHNTSLKLPINVHNAKYKINKFIESYQKVYGINPSVEEIASELNITKEKIIEYLNISPSTKSLNEQAFDDNEEIEYQNLLVDDKANVESIIEKELFLIENNKDFRQLLKENLSKSELKIIALRYGFYDDKIRNSKEIAEILSLTEHSVREIGYRAKKKLKQPKIIRKIKEIYTL